MQQTIAIVGLGYVGLPLAHAFAKKGYRVIGYDVNEERISTLKNNKDWTGELAESQLKEVEIEFGTNPEVIKEADIVIVALPTPVDEGNRPDLTILKAGTTTVGQNLKSGATVVFESTVYPGVTEDICGPILEKESGGKNFKLGYSPERVNPGDKEHTITKITKVVAGEDEETTDSLCDLYESIIEAGVYRASSIKVAEMYKAIENAQRDLNIAYINEIAKLCNKLDISTKDVLDAAGSKWNFLPFKPGLVGGHCIGVDPYYLVELARDKDTMMRLIESARDTNSEMADYVAGQIVNELSSPSENSVLILGTTFKEDVPDMRNSQNMKVVDALKNKGCSVDTDDPYNKRCQTDENSYDAIALLVPHREYLDMSLDELLKPLKEGGVFYDLKSVLDKKEIEEGGYRYLGL
ncbi:nucleotide sugar dehydrogenase [Patescibacteria group bacterium]|nr:nucleotide sugar dehydrogenase [Patescibacteria group bacterium]